MDTIRRMSESIAYMEEHLSEEITLEDIANKIYTSKFHYQRMFRMLTGITVMDYLRRRRLTLAGEDLLQTEEKVVNLAFKYGYETPESFSKAFRALHGVSPSQARKTAQTLKMYPRLSFQIQVKGDEEMNYTVEEKGAFQVVGQLLRVTMKNEGNFTEIPKFWSESHQNGTVHRLLELSDDGHILGVCTDYNPTEEQFSYLIAIKKPSNPVPDEFEEKEIPASLWAKFEVIGAMPDAIQEVTKRVYTEFFPSTSYEHAGTADLEIYHEGDPSAKDYKSEVWVPIIKP